MDRRQVEHVKAHRGNVIQPANAIEKSAMLGRVGGTRPRKHLVPTAEPRLLAVHQHAQLARVRGGAAAIRIPRHEFGKLGAAHHSCDRAVLRDRQQPELRSKAVQFSRVVYNGPAGGGLDQIRANQQVHRNILARIIFLQKIAAPTSGRHPPTPESCRGTAPAW